MTHPHPGTDPVGPQPDPDHPTPAQPGPEQGAWAPQPGPWAPQQPGAWAPQGQGPWGPPPQGAWYPPQDGASAAPGTTTGGVRKWLRIGVPIAVVGVVGLGTVGSYLGFGDPEVGDCVQMLGETDVEVVDCGSAEAEYRIVGIEDEEQTYPEFMADQNSCSEFPAWEAALWIGGLQTEPGTVYCAEPN